MSSLVLVSVVLLSGDAEVAGRVSHIPTLSVAMANHIYEARIRLNGKVSTTQVQASDAGQAKKLVQAQYGPSVTVLSVKKVD